MTLSFKVEEELPLKQGLKQTNRIYGSIMLNSVEEELPLKQGLKLRVRNIAFQQLRRVEEELPLKQGLKHEEVYYIIFFIGC